MGGACRTTYSGGPAGYHFVQRHPPRRNTASGGYSRGRDVSQARAAIKTKPSAAQLHCNVSAVVSNGGAYERRPSIRTATELLTSRTFEAMRRPSSC